MKIFADFLIDQKDEDNLEIMGSPSRTVKGWDTEFNDYLHPFKYGLSNESVVVQTKSLIYDQNWLIQKTANHINKFMKDSGIDYKQLSTSILQALQVGQDLESKLIDLLGFADLELVGELLANSGEIVQTITDAAIARKMAHVAETNQKTAELENVVVVPRYGSQITITSETEKNALKQLRKERKHHSKFAQDLQSGLADALLDFDGAHLKAAREDQLAKNAAAPLLKSATDAIKYPHVYDHSTGGSVLSAFGTRYTLPSRSERKDHKDYEQISIPISTKPTLARERLKIESLSEFAQKGFQGYETLNPVQTIVFPTVFESNENILVCAPTGAGKTDIAMLSILRCISQHMDEKSQIAKDAFKIIYIAPMKALAAEIANKFSKRLSVFNLKVKELTGDMQLTKAEISESQMLVVTPEKFDIVGRKSTGDTELMQKVRLLIIDEVHLLNEDRGSVIETIVARTQRLVESSQTLIRIVGLSATLPNYVDVATFLGVNPYHGLFYFDSTYRPVPLEQHFIGVKAKPGSVVFKTKLDEVCYEKASLHRKEGYQVMIFVHARKETVKTAQNLRIEAQNRGSINDFSIKEDPQYNFFKAEVQKSRNKELKELFEFGLGIHHAGMT